MNAFPWISILTFLPLAGGLIAMSLAEEQAKLARRLALGVSLAALGLALLLWSQFVRDRHRGAMSADHECARLLYELMAVDVLPDYLNRHHDGDAITAVPSESIHNRTFST